MMYFIINTKYIIDTDKQECIICYNDDCNTKIQCCAGCKYNICDSCLLEYIMSNETFNINCCICKGCLIPQNQPSDNSGSDDLSE